MKRSDYPPVYASSRRISGRAYTAEVMVVDNGSTDGTAEVVRAAAPLARPTATANPGAW